jgi:hypothetical protein
MTTVMIVLICLGCAAIVAGLALLVYRAIQVIRVARAAGKAASLPLQLVIRKAGQLQTRMEGMAESQKEMAERLERLSATSRQLNYLKESVDEAIGHITSLKS